MTVTHPLVVASVLALATCCTTAVSAQRYNAVPAQDNAYNTPIDKTANSPGFRCDATVASVWATASGDVYAAFSDDRIWYRVEKATMHPLIYTAYSLGRKVCYQTKGYPTETIGVNVVFFDPVH